MKRAHVLAAAGAVTLALTACSPTQVSSSGSEEDLQDGTLRVWLFNEVDQAPKEAVVDAAVEEFEGDHDGLTVEVQYIPVESRAERFTAAFNDPSSAPDVAEIGNTDLAGYVAAGGLADVSTALEEWDSADDLDQDAVATTQVDGAGYAIPWFVGVRALFYRTDVFDQLGLQPPTTMDEIAEAGRAVHAADPGMVGVAAGGAYQFAAMPYIWAHGGALAEEVGDGFESRISTPESQEGVAAYTELLADDICPPQTCAEWGGNDSVEQFSSGGAGMTFGGNFNLAAVDDSVVGDSYGVLPVPGTEAGSVAPAFAGGNHLAVLASTERQSLATEFAELLAGPDYQRQMFDAMGNLPTLSSVRGEVAEAAPQTAPFIEMLEAGTDFVPVTAAWGAIDADGVVVDMLQSVATGRADVAQATATAAEQMDAAFAAQ